MIYLKPKKDEQYQNILTGALVTVITIVNCKDDTDHCQYSPEVVVYDDNGNHCTAQTENFVQRFKRV